MFRVVSSVILLVAFAIQSFHLGGIVIDYHLNTSAYSKNCENKAKPILKCNGKCQLGKKLLEEQKKEEQAPDRKQENKTEVFCSHPDTGIVPIKILCSAGRHPLYPVSLTQPLYQPGVFHPPCVG